MKLVWIAVWVPALCAQVVPDRYIVELEGRPAAVSAMSRQALDMPRRTVRAEQARLQPRLERCRRARDRGRGNRGQCPHRGDIGGPGCATGHARRRRPRASGQAGEAISGPRARRCTKCRMPGRPSADPANAGAGIKIGIIDSGIAQDHPAFQGTSLPLPPGFPLANQPRDLAYTNNKVIVARNYVTLATPQDSFGHGTAVAMEAAGASAAGPLGVITGVAPAGMARQL